MTINKGRRHFIAGAAALAGSALAAPSIVRAQAKKLDVLILHSNGNAQLALEQLLKKLGYLEELGLNATTEMVGNGSRITASLLSNSADVCMLAGFGQVLPAVAQGGNLKVIAGGNMLTAQGVMTNSASIKSVKDLAGKKIGSGPPGALLHQLMVAMLIKHGVDPASVSFVNSGGTAEVYRAVVAGVVDAGPVAIDVYNQQKGDLKIIADFWTDLKEFPYQGAFTSDETIKTKRETLVRTLAAYAKMYRFLHTPESKSAYVESYVKGVGGNASAADAEKQWQFTYDNKAFAANLVIPDSAFDFIQDLNIKTDAQKVKLPIEKVFDMSLAREAIKMIS